MITESVLKAYHFESDNPTVEPFGTGLINHTWKLTDGDKEYILQRVNDAVFANPQGIADNLTRISAYLRIHHPEYFFVSPVVARDGEGMIGVKQGYFRLFPFVPGSRSIDVVETVNEAKEAAKQFGRFTNRLSGFDATSLHVTIPSFHDLSLRFQQFVQATKHCNAERKAESANEIEKLMGWSGIVDRFERIKSSPAFRIRVTHHDTKISNTLFDDDGKGICVIDLDTVMPGYFISDFGDMMRTYLSPVSEEEGDLSKIQIRDEYFRAICDGYLGEMGSELTEDERAHLVYAGQFMIYMQALRFLTDHLNNDIYYGARYPGHNLVRARNQVRLLELLLMREKAFTSFVAR